MWMDRIGYHLVKIIGFVYLLSYPTIQRLILLDNTFGRNKRSQIGLDRRAAVAVVIVVVVIVIIIIIIISVVVVVVVSLVNQMKE